MNTEQALLDRIFAGEAAEGEFMALFKPRLLRATRLCLGSQDEGNEAIVHATLEYALHKLKAGSVRAPLYVWLRQVCLRLCYIRLQERKWALAELARNLQLALPGSDAWADGSGDVQTEKTGPFRS